MPDALMYDEEMFVLLETNQPEQFVTAPELLQKLESILKTSQVELTPDLQQLTTAAAQAQQLLNTACELDLGPDRFLQWYAVRLEK